MNANLARKALVAASIALASACSPSSAGAVEVDLALTNGNIATMEPESRFVSTVIVGDGRIVAVGDASVLDGYEPAEVLDLEGRTVLPGFVDNHVHPSTPQRFPPTVVDLRYAYTWEENVTRLSEALEGLPPGAWLRASAFRGYFADHVPATPWFNADISRIPDRHALDEIAPNNPVVVRASQFVVANTMALRLAGVTRDSADPVDGRIERDADGEPTGVLWYSVGDALEAFAPQPPPFPPLSEREGFLAYKDFFVSLRTLGVTSLNIAGARDPEMLRLYQDLQTEFAGELPRMTVQPWLNAGHSQEVVDASLALLEGYGWRTGAGDEWLKLGAIKMGLDGGYTFSRPWPINEQPHKHVPTYYGGWRDDPDKFYQIFRRAHALGWQIGAHSAGDRASRMVTDVFERVLEEYPREDHRHHLIHFEVPPTEDTFEKMERLGLGVAMQPNFTYGLQPFFSLALDGERLQRNNPSRSVLDHGIHLSFGSDERPYGPLIGIYAAVTRRGYDGEVYGPEEAITVEEAVRAYTIDSAWHTFDEDTRGSIEPGKVADFVVLSEDIFTIDPERIIDVEVVSTILAGRVFEAPEGAKNRYHPDDPNPQ